jgi:hypothetical protein
MRPNGSGDLAHQHDGQLFLRVHPEKGAGRAAPPTPPNNALILLSPNPRLCLPTDSISCRSRRCGDLRNPTFVDEGAPMCALGPQEGGEII